MYKKCKLKLFFLIYTLLIQHSAAIASATHEKIGFVLLHGLGASAEMCREWVAFALENDIHPPCSQFAVYIPEAKDRSWFDINPLLPDLIHISEPANQTPENMAILLSKIKDAAPQFHDLSREINAFREREEIEVRNLHFVGYSQGGIFAQMLAYSLPSPCGSLFFAGCPWIPDENIQKPRSIIMAINNDDPLFGKVYQCSRELFNQKVGEMYFSSTVKEAIESEGGHDISQAAKIIGINHFKAVLGISSEESAIIDDTIN